MEEALDKELEGDAVPKRSSSSIPLPSEEAIDVGVDIEDSGRDDAAFHRAGGTAASFEEEEGSF